ncbi:MAG: orotidine-5'-phosphate decarboxylase [bacterium]
MMVFVDRLTKVTSSQNSLLCVGLDPDLKRLPRCMRSDANPLFKFCSEIIASTNDLVASYKLNFAFFEAEGLNGWSALEKLMHIIPPSILTIADAKRADIGNSSLKYAESILQRLNFDAVTVSPYMGEDSVRPFLQWPEKGAFILALTSNPGCRNFQHLQINARPLYKKVVKETLKWNTRNNCGVVVGATHPDELDNIRNLAPNLPFLIPGVGAQGGHLQEAVKYGTDRAGGLALISSSRGVIYKSNGTDFAEAARQEAEFLNKRINQYREEKLRAAVEHDD